MKIILTSLLALMAQLLTAQTLEGPYSGELDVMGQMKLNITFRFTNDSCTMDVLEQNVKAFPMQAVSLRPDSLHLTVPALGIDYKGKAQNDTVKGTFSQNGLSLPLNLVKGEVTVVRPQTPQPPLPYGTQEVTFTNPADGAVLAGTLTYPFGYSSRKAKPPVVLMVSGSGQQNRDEELFNHKPFLVLADRLAKLGVASLRYDDRGTAQSTGSLENATTLTFAADAAAGIDYLQQTDKFSAVGVLGHSEGSLIAFMLKPDFIVSLAGMAVSGKETLLWQNRLLFEASGIPQETVDQILVVIDNIYDKVVQDEQESIDYSLAPEAHRPALQQGIKQLSTPYMKHLITVDVRPQLPQIKCPVLALIGTKDTQVNCQTNLEAIDKGITAPHQVVAMEGLNHLFQHCTTGSFVEYPQIEETFDPETLQKIIKWIKAKKKKKQRIVEQ